MYKQYVAQLDNGMSWVSMAADNFKYEDMKEKVLEVFNGDHEEGYALEKYFFESSFDDESCAMGGYTEELGVGTPWEESKLLYDNEYDNVEMVVYGLHQMADALEKLSVWVRLRPYVKNILLETKSEGGYNPFTSYGLLTMERLVKGWKRAFLKELKDKVGKRKMENSKQKMERVYYKEIGKPTFYVHNPVTMDETNTHIEVANEMNGFEAETVTFSKDTLRKVNKERYKKEYLEVFLPSLSQRIEAEDEELLDELKQVFSYNNAIMDKVDYDQGLARNLIEFEDESGQMIWNPFYDSTGRFEVNPIQEYGRENVKNMIDVYKKIAN